ncbi:MAG: YceI family protein [Chitinophagales bacterium]
MILLCLISLLNLLQPTKLQSQEKFVYSGNKGKVHFVSNAPLEHIEATSNQLSGGMNAQTREIYFTLRIVSFNGFNSGLQQEHFNENYLESELYPTSNFKGKLVDEVDLTKNGIYNVRVKGFLTIHGVSVERIISGKITVNGNTMQIESNFPVLLADYNITVPRIVEMKIAKEIMVDVKIDLTRNPA